jgi:hypothetical protein
MSSSIRRATAATLLILAAGWGLSSHASAAPPRVSTAAAPSSTTASSPTAAQNAAAWLGRQFTGGSIQSNGTPDPGSTVLAVLAFAASGVGGRKAHAAMVWLKRNFESYVSTAGVDSAGSLATLILAAHATGISPLTFGGHRKANDLVRRLLDSQQTSGTDAGLFGATDPTYDGAFRQGLSLMALATQGTSNPLGVTWLQNQQCADGGWESYRSDLTSPCPAPDPTAFSGPDTNSTALAVEGLVAQGQVASGVTFPVDPAAFFESSQDTDGGFAYIGATGQSSDPDSTAEVIQALVALGELTNPAFTQSGGATPVSALAGFQLGCGAAAADRGAYVFPGVDGPNLLATLQAVPGAAELAFPLGAQTLRSALPKMKCPAH